MVLHRFLHAICFFACLAGASSAYAEFPASTFAPVHGFRLGSSLAEAKQHASDKGWMLRELHSELPGNWVVEGQEIGLFVCEDRITAITETRDGDVDAFALLVADHRRQHGDPVTKISSFTIGPKRISNIDASFTAASGDEVVVQLAGNAGHLKISVTFRLSQACGVSSEP